MATILGEMQFEILPVENADFGVTFGIGCDVSIDEGGFQPGGPDWYTEDSENPFNGATAFGQDHTIAPEWQWSMHVNQDQTANATRALAELSRAWRGNAARSVIGEVCVVRYQMSGQTRRVYGRPRRFEYTPDNKILTGFIPVQANFKCADSNIYDDVLTQVVIETSPDQDAPKSGLVFPTVFPIQLKSSNTGGAAGFVDGDEETYPVIRFYGPLTNPKLQTSDWEVSLTTTLGGADMIEIDTRPWKQTVLLNGDYSVAAVLGKRQWLSDMKLAPGRNYDFAFRANSENLGGRCEVSWRSAYSSI